jgi:hypothetical protein
VVNGFASLYPETVLAQWPAIETLRAATQVQRILVVKTPLDAFLPGGVEPLQRILEQSAHRVYATYPGRLPIEVYELEHSRTR